MRGGRLLYGRLALDLCAASRQSKSRSQEFLQVSSGAKVEALLRMSAALVRDLLEGNYIAEMKSDLSSAACEEDFL